MKQNDTDSARTAMAWNRPVWLLQWLTAASLAGAAFLTSPEHAGHAWLGWAALGMLLLQLPAAAGSMMPAPARWLAAALVLGLNLSGVLSPEAVVHTGATLATLVMAAWYCAAVLFETLQRMTAGLAR